MLAFVTLLVIVVLRGKREKRIIHNNLSSAKVTMNTALALSWHRRGHTFNTCHAYHFFPIFLKQSVSYGAFLLSGFMQRIN